MKLPFSPRGGSDLESQYPSWFFLPAGMLGLLAWARWLSVWWLLIPVGSFTLWAARNRARRPGLTAAALLLLLGSLVGFIGHFQLLTVSTGAESLSGSREETLDRGAGGSESDRFIWASCRRSLDNPGRWGSMRLASASSPVASSSMW